MDIGTGFIIELLLLLFFKRNAETNQTNNLLKAAVIAMMVEGLNIMITGKKVTYWLISTMLPDILLLLPEIILRAVLLAIIYNSDSRELGNSAIITLVKKFLEPML